MAKDNSIIHKKNLIVLIPSEHHHLFMLNQIDHVQFIRHFPDVTCKMPINNRRKKKQQKVYHNLCHNNAEEIFTNDFQVLILIICIFPSLAKCKTCKQEYTEKILVNSKKKCLYVFTKHLLLNAWPLLFIPLPESFL